MTAPGSPTPREALVADLIDWARVLEGERVFDLPRKFYGAKQLREAAALLSAPASGLREQVEGLRPENPNATRELSAYDKAIRDVLALPTLSAPDAVGSLPKQGSREEMDLLNRISARVEFKSGAVGLPVRETGEGREALEAAITNVRLEDEPGATAVAILDVEVWNRFLLAATRALRATVPEQREPDGWVNAHDAKAYMRDDRDALMIRRSKAFADVHSPVYIGGTPPTNPEVDMPPEDFETAFNREPLG